MADTVMVFGESGAYKTTNLGFAAKYLYEKTGGKKGRLISADGGGWKPIEPLIRVGIIEPLRMLELKFPLPTFRKLSTGWWPDKLENGYLPEGFKLFPPTPETWTKVGFYLIEGGTSISDVMMEDLRDKQRKISEETPGRFDEEGEKFGAHCKSHYGFVQREMLARLKSFGALPCDRVIWSAHEATGEDEDTKQPIRGPGLAGKAATDKVAPCVGDCLHFEQYRTVGKATGGDKDKVEIATTKVRAFFVPHPDQKFSNIMYKCKPRVPGTMISELLKKWPGGFFEPQPNGGLDEFLRFEDELVERAAGSEEEWKKLIDEKLKKAA